MKNWKIILAILTANVVFMSASYTMLIPFLPMYLVRELGVSQSEVTMWSGVVFSVTFLIGGIMAPEMQKNGYDEDFSLATAAAAGTLGQIIPPSVGMVSYAVLAEVSVGTLFLTGFGPGILMAVFMLIYAHIYVKKNPNIKTNGQKVMHGKGRTQPFRSCSIRRKLGFH